MSMKSHLRQPRRWLFAFAGQESAFCLEDKRL